MQALAEQTDTTSWSHVLRDVLTFQFKLVVDGLKDLGLAQVALGAALVDAFKRDGSPGRRFYAIVRLSDRFDRWLDIHEPLSRVPDDAPEYVGPAVCSVDDLIDGIENSARTVADVSAKATRSGAAALRSRQPARRAFGGI